MAFPRACITICGKIVDKLVPISGDLFPKRGLRRLAEWLHFYPNSLKKYNYTSMYDT